MAVHSFLKKSSSKKFGKCSGVYLNMIATFVKLQAPKTKDR